MVPFRFEITLNELTPARMRLTDAARHLRPLMEIAGGIFENSTRARFAGEYGPGRIPWPATWKQRAGATAKGKVIGPIKSGKSLQDSGSLLSSIRSNVGDDYVETGPDGRSKTSRLSIVHQKGWTIKPKRAKLLAFVGPDGRFRMATSVTIPARPHMGIDAEDQADLQDAFADYLGSAWNGR